MVDFSIKLEGLGQEYAGMLLPAPARAGLNGMVYVKRHPNAIGLSVIGPGFISYK